MGILKDTFEKRSNSYVKDFLKGYDYFGVKTKSGVRISENNAMQINAVFGCVRVISQAVAKTPLILWGRSQKGKYIAFSQKLHDRFIINVNEYMTPFQFKEKTLIDLLLWGNSYWVKSFDNEGIITGLYPLFPDRMKINVDNKFVKTYEYTTPAGNIVTLLDYEVLHIPGMGFDGFQGFSPIQLQKESLGLDAGMAEYASKFFSQGANMGGVITSDKVIDKTSKDDIREMLKARAEGLHNAHKTIILDGGVKYEQLRMSNDDAQLLESRRFTKEEISNIYGVPLHLLGSLERSTNNNIEQQGRDFLNFCISPWLARITESINLQLLFNDERKYFYFEFDTSEFTVPDAVSRATYYSKLVPISVLNPNECRELESYNSYEKGNEFLRMVNIASINDINKNVQEQNKMGEAVI